MEQQEEVSDILSSAKRNCQNVTALPKNSMPLGNEIRERNNITMMKNSMANISLSSNFSTSSSGFYFSTCTNVNNKIRFYEKRCRVAYGLKKRTKTREMLSSLCHKKTQQQQSEMQSLHSVHRIKVMSRCLSAPDATSLMWSAEESRLNSY